MLMKFTYFTFIYLNLKIRGEIVTPTTVFEILEYFY